jgi:beta-fructofuranosidase
MSIKALEKRNSNPTDEALASYAFSGFFDHGCYYAANSFWDAQTSQQIVFGWITEEDLSDSLRHRQGFSGLTSLPRVVELMTLTNVKKARNSSLSSITSIEAVPDAPGTGTFTVHTMKIRPDSRFSRLREGAQKSQLVDIPLSTTAKVMTALQSTKWEIKAEFCVGKSCTRVGIKIPHTSGKNHSIKSICPINPPTNALSDSQDQNCTTLSWTPDSETFTINRPHLDNAEINQGFETAPHTLFTFLNEQGQEIEETLRVRAFFDASVLEVFVNDRTVISTRIYYPEDHCFGPIFFAEADTAESDAQPAALLMKSDVWDGIGV